MMRSGTVLLLLTTLPVACVIDGVPLPDETDTRNEGTEAPADSAAVAGVFATRSSGVTLVFGVPASVVANASIVASSGLHQARTAAGADGSFNVTLSGELDATITLSVLVGGAVVAATTLETPAAGSLQVPSGASLSGELAPSATSSSTRLDPSRATLAFPSGSFASNVAVAIVNVNRGTTETAVAAGDGSLTVTVLAASGDALYIVALANTGASAPYIVTVQ